MKEIASRMENNMKLGLLFAGQGSQKTGMGEDLYDTYPAFRRIFDLLSEEQRTAIL